MVVHVPRRTCPTSKGKEEFSGIQPNPGRNKKGIFRAGQFPGEETKYRGVGHFRTWDPGDPVHTRHH